MTNHEKIEIKGSILTWDGYELDISMSFAGLSDLLNSLRNRAYGVYRFDQISAEEIGTLRTLEIKEGEGKLRLSVHGAQAKLIGSQDSISLLADNIDGLLSLWAAGGNQHFHFDPSSDQLLLMPDSEAFILSPRRMG